MARPGVPQDQVFASADALLAAGERPTTDKVRAALGRGSPNAIAPMLDAWWAQLAQRLRQHQALPDLPPGVAEAFIHAWALALEAGQVHAESLVAPERAALAEVLARTEAAAAAHQSQLTTARQERDQAIADAKVLQSILELSEQRVADGQREVATLSASTISLGQQREAAEARLLVILTQADVDRVAAASERERLQSLLSQVEDRAYTEVDRARQELKALKAQLVTQAREHATALRTHEQARRTAEAALIKAQRETTALQTRLARLTAKAPAVAPGGAARRAKS